MGGEPARRIVAIHRQIPGEALRFSRVARRRPPTNEKRPNDRAGGRSRRAPSTANARHAALGRVLFLAVVENVGQDHHVRTVREARLEQGARLVDGLEARHGEIDHLEASARFTIQGAFDALGPGVVELDARTPRERVPQRDHPN